MKSLGTFLISVAVIFGITLGILRISGSYEYEKEIKSYWSLADKASTIDQKSTYIDQFVNALEESDMHGQYNALIFKTPDNSFDSNFEALKSLQTRLHEISVMDVKSFEYQTAIQQITAQEQGEASHMLNTFEQIWWKTHCILLWDFVAVINIVIVILSLLVGLALKVD